MINLPKPPQLRMNGETQEQINCLVSYLKTLVNTIERLLSGIKQSTNDGVNTVKDISMSNGKIIITYTDGSTKNLDI